MFIELQTVCERSVLKSSPTQTHQEQHQYELTVIVFKICKTHLVINLNIYCKHVTSIYADTDYLENGAVSLGHTHTQDDVAYE